MHVVTIIGNRPQFVKAAAVSHRLREQHDETLIHTGQHYDDELSTIFFEELGIPKPDRELRLGTGTNTQQTARMIASIDDLMDDLDADCVLVYGDTNTTLAAAVVAAQRRVPLVHVEAGMRSFDRSMPEEFNRLLTDHASDLLLCSTPTAVTNLEQEGFASGVELVGDVMADVALRFLEIARERSNVIETLDLEMGAYTLVTAHRAGNVDTRERLERLVDVLVAVPGRVVFPVHPRTAARLDEHGLRATLEASAGIDLLPPVGYLDLLRLADGASAVLTDSGGLQKEAYVVGTPCVTLRDTTEWVETVDSGWNQLVDLDRERALAALAARPSGHRPDLYRAGRAADAVVAALAGGVGLRSGKL